MWCEGTQHSVNAEGQKEADGALGCAAEPSAWGYRSDQQHCGIGRVPFRLVEEEEGAGTAQLSLCLTHIKCSV